MTPVVSQPSSALCHAGVVRFLNAACTGETFGPVGFSQVIDPDRFARAGRVDEFAVANVNAHMAEGAPHGVEEHQVAWVQVVAVNFFGRCCLFVGSAGQQTPNRRFVNVAHKAAAVKAGFF